MAEASDDLPRAPRAAPRWLVDGLLVLLAGAFWAAALQGDLLVFQEAPPGEQSVPFAWDARRLAGIACAPLLLALLWRRRRPVAVLGIALAITIPAFEYSALMGAIALYTAATVLGLRRTAAAVAAAVALELAGFAAWLGTPGWDDALLMVVSTSVAAALGLYVGARRAYFDRLRERALFARALASFLPAGVAELIEESPSALSLERELEATVLFSDIRGFSTVAEQLAPRDVADVLGRHASAMSEVVLAHGGMLDKFAGDGVMAVFGAPRPVPGDPDRAIACAIAMQRRQAELNDAPHRQGPPLAIGIGINTGTVIAGTLGGAGRLDYTVLGDAVNVAQRLQTEAGPGEILISAATAARCSWPSAEPAGERRLKGRTEPVEVFRVGWERETAERS